MKKYSFIALTIMMSFCFGFAFKTLITKSPTNQSKFKKVTGVGGIFFKCKDPGKLNEWYNSHLGLNTGKYGTTFVWWQGADSTKKGYTQWSPFKETTSYFGPSNQDFMINYRVENLGLLVEQLTKEGVTIADTMQTVSYGKFIHILDLEGNKVELWEPNDIEYGKIEGVQTK